MSNSIPLSPCPRTTNSTKLPFVDSYTVEPQFAEPSSPASPPIAFKSEGVLASRALGVRLDIEDLPCFAQVERQYESWGIVFKNAVAICPSNPAYRPHSGVKVLLGAPQDGWIEANFLKPVHHVSGFITSSRRTIISAFNSSNQLVAQVETLPVDIPSKPQLTPQAGKQSVTHQYSGINQKFSLSAAQIHRITLQTFNGHVTVDDFCFCA